MKITVLFIVALLFSFSVMAQKDTTTYVLKGSFENFQFLYNALKSPIDITPRQRDSILIRWLETIKPEEKKEEPKVDKPKKK